MEVAEGPFQRLILTPVKGIECDGSWYRKDVLSLLSFRENFRTIRAVCSFHKFATATPAILLSS